MDKDKKQAKRTPTTNTSNTSAEREKDVNRSIKSKNNADIDKDDINI